MIVNEGLVVDWSHDLKVALMEFCDAVFEARVGPVRDAPLRLLDASDELQGTWGSMAAADSQAMAELAAEDQFQGETPWGTDPMLQAHNLGMAPIMVP